MSLEPATATTTAPKSSVQRHPPRRYGIALLALLSLVALASSLVLWQKLANIQHQLARQSADSHTAALEARLLARTAQELAQGNTARLALNESRLNEVALQRSQLDELMQSLSRSRDDNLVVDIESSLRLAQQQAQLTGSSAPLLSALKTADQRIGRAAQPRLAPLQRALSRDIERVQSASLTDTPALLARLDELLRLATRLQPLNAVQHQPRPAAAATAATSRPNTSPSTLAWWRQQLQRGWQATRDEARKLVRVSRIDHPEAALLAPEQSFFLQENLRLHLLSARLGVLARQTASAQSDLDTVGATLGKYFDPNAGPTQAVLKLLRQARADLQTLELPRIDDSLTALSNAAAGR